ncbi:MAG: YcxB family protein [Verrucomicrobia bacterium]|nr:YcxB family protein [Verrucomicrobiota bacterium]
MGQTSTAWQAVERVANTGDHAFVYTSAMAAIIVPRRAFSSAAEFDQFVRAASDYNVKAKAEQRIGKD